MDFNITDSTIDWSSIIKEKRSSLLWTCQKILNCPKLAEDVLHDAYLRLTQLSPEKTIEIKKPEYYIFQVVRNISIDHKRKFNREGGYLTELTDEIHIADTANGPEQIVQEHNVLSSIEKSLSKLPQRTREVFEVYRHGNFTQVEISKKYDISPTLVNFLLKDAIKSCRNDLLR